MARVLTCIDPLPAPDGSCIETVWLEHPSMLPTMTLEQGRDIGHAFLLAMITVAAIKVFLNPNIHRKT